MALGKENEMTYLFVTGMFRSGTTLLARVLNAHPGITLCSDPFFEFFKEIRNIFFKEIDTGIFNEGSPLEDYFLAAPDIRKEFHQNFREIKVPPDRLDILQEKIADAAKPYSPKIIPYLSRLTRQRVKDLLIQMMEILSLAYPKDEGTVIGMKETWTDEFAAPLMNMEELPFRCLQIVRDPRGVVASKKKDPLGHYPLAFLIRQWRKSIAFGIMNDHNEKYHRVRYEDLVHYPENTLKRICHFISLPFNHQMTDFTNIKNGEGKPWLQNSFFGTSQSFNPHFMYKWKETLTPNELGVIEFCCQSEMDLMGYELTHAEPSTAALFNYSDDSEKLTAWIRKFYPQWNTTQMEEEIIRRYILKKSTLSWGEDILSRFFIDPMVYEKLAQ